MPNLSNIQTKRKTQEASNRKTNFYPVFKTYTQEEAVLEASRCLNCPNPMCKKGCPIENDIPQFLAAVANKNFKEAYEILLRKTCMPDICGTICPHEDQCCGHCVRGIKGEPVNIGAVEGFVASWAKENNLTIDQIVPNKKEKFAVIGSGPAGLSFALLAAKNGYKVTIYEKDSYIGGILKWGIPSFRLEESILKNYIYRLQILGVEFVLNYPVGKEHPLSELQEKYDCVFIGTGASIPNKMNIEGENLEGIYSGTQFLKAINLNEINDGGRKIFKNCGKNVVVVGGGNVAMDAARCAIRQPQVKNVYITYRRSENEMPACKEELLQAKEEGIQFLTLTNPVKFIGKDNKVNKVECALMELGEPDASGRRRPIQSSKPHIFIEADTIVLALGYTVDKEIAETSSLEIDKWGCFVVDENNNTSLNNVYAAGDNVTGPKTVVLAMKAGMKAFEDIKQKFNK